MSESLLRRVARAIAPLGADAVVIGGTAHALFPRHRLGAAPPYELLRTDDVDVAANADLEQSRSGDRALLLALEAEELEDTVSGAAVPKHRHVAAADAGHVEFVVPRRGGRRFGPMRFGGVFAERLEAVDLLLHEPWLADLGGDPPVRVHVANPVAYVCQKVLTAPARAALADRAKDWLYVLDTLVVFAGALPELAASAPALLPGLTAQRRRRLAAAIAALQPSTPEIREACRIARSVRSDPPRPADLAAALRDHVPGLVGR